MIAGVRHDNIVAVVSDKYGIPDVDVLIRKERLAGISRLRLNINTAARQTSVQGTVALGDNTSGDQIGVIRQLVTDDSKTIVIFRTSGICDVTALDEYAQRSADAYTVPPAPVNGTSSDGNILATVTVFIIDQRDTVAADIFDARVFDDDVLTTAHQNTG